MAKDIKTEEETIDLIVAPFPSDPQQRRSPPSPVDRNDPAAVDRYLFDMIGQLREIANAHHRELLAYFLGIAQAEAGDANWRAVKTNCRAPAARPRFRSAQSPLPPGVASEETDPIEGFTDTTAHLE